MVGGADFYALQTVEHIQFGETEAGYAVDLDCFAHSNGIKPTAATLTASGRAKFVTDSSQMFADSIAGIGSCVVRQFGRKWARTYTRGVSLGDTEDIIQIQRAETGTGSRAACGGVG